MGHYSHTCKLSGLPITGNTPVVLFPLIPNRERFDNSEDSLAKYGTTYQCSNDGMNLQYYPIWFPIKGDYDEYGGIENIIEDDNTKALEEYYDLKIQDICNVLTSGRKDDGFDESLSVIKIAPELPKDWVEGEDWFARYQRKQKDPMPFGNGVYPDVSGKYRKEWEQEEGYEGWTITRGGKKVKATKEEYDADFKLIHEQYARYQEWCKKNPDPTDDYRSPNYQKRYKELLKISGMWIHRTVYEDLIKEPVKSWDDHLDLGNHNLLEALGFKKLKAKSKDDRYTMQYQYKDIIVNSDGTWIRIPGKWNQFSVYRVNELARYCDEVKGQPLEEGWKRIDKLDKVEQIYEFILPGIKTLYGYRELRSMLADKNIPGVALAFKTLGLKTFEKAEEYINIFHNSMLMDDPGRMLDTVKYKFLNSDRYSMNNHMSEVYFQAAKKGKLKSNLVEFWRFEHYLWATGTYYAPVGVSPQDGEHEAVFKVLQSAIKVIKPEIKYRKEEEAEEA